jgi:hypothetical protein
MSRPRASNHPRHRATSAQPQSLKRRDPAYVFSAPGRGIAILILPVTSPVSNRRGDRRQHLLSWRKRLRRRRQRLRGPRQRLRRPAIRGLIRRIGNGMMRHAIRVMRHGISHQWPLRHRDPSRSCLDRMDHRA